MARGSAPSSAPEHEDHIEWYTLPQEILPHPAQPSSKANNRTDRVVHARGENAKTVESE
jgi:hypothetical protein